MLETIIEWDKELFLFLNQLHTPFWDVIMSFASAKYTWSPFYLIIILFIGWKYRWKTAGILIFIAITITLTDQISVNIVKEFFQRARPCNNPEIANLTHIVEGCGGGYAFVSAHATNVFGGATFVSKIYKHKYMTIIMVIWATLVAYSRIYLGVHYPADIIGGAVLGLIIGTFTAYGYALFEQYAYPVFKRTKNN